MKYSIWEAQSENKWVDVASADMDQRKTESIIVLSLAVKTISPRRATIEKEKLSQFLFSSADQV